MSRTDRGTVHKQAERGRRQGHGSSHDVFPKSALLALVVGIVVTVLLFAQVYRLETANDNIAFTKRAELLLGNFEESLREAVAGLRSVNQLFAVNNTAVSREQFREFTLPLLEQYPYVGSFAFRRYVTNEERPAYEAAMRKYYPGFTIKQVRQGKILPATGLGPWLVVEYIEPSNGNNAALGINSLHGMSSERAIDSGTLTASPLIRVPRPFGRGMEGKLFAIMLPLYRRGALLYDVPSRRQAYIGDTMASLDATRFARQVFSRAGLLDMHDTRVSVYSAVKADEAALVFRHGATPTPATEDDPFAAQLIGPPSLISVSRNVDVVGIPWHIVVSRATPDISTGHPKSLLVLVAGLLFSILSMSYLRAAALRSRLIEKTVDERTSELQATSRELQLRNRAIEASANAIFITSSHGPDYIVEYVNPAFERITGYPSTEIVGQPLRLLAGADEQSGLVELMEAMAARREAHTTARNYRKDGTMYWNEAYVAPVRDENGEVHHFVHVHYDVTETKRYQEQLEYRANFDPLTGLANRNLLQDRLQQAISYASRFGRTVWVAFIDLDRFKFVNDSAGHSYGDTLLNIVAERMKACVRAADTVGRMGGDEFVLVLPQYDNGPMSADTIEKIMTQVARPISIGGKEFFVSCSIGIAVFPDDGSTAEILLTHADIAMYRAKEMGRNNFQFFEPSLNARTQARLRIEGALRNALARNEFLLHYQPQVDLRNGQMVGVEALIRWQHPVFGLVSPTEFISLTEETGLIVPIGVWALRTACAQNQAWQAAGLGKVRVAVNLSGIQFAQPDIVQIVASALDESGLDPAHLEIELTESVVMHDVERTVATLHHLKALGVHLSVDDFGTGYSSLAYLKRFPINVLKIDQSFVRDISTEQDDATIVVSIISLAHNLRLRVIAEGVETAEQLEFLRHHNCDEIQGYYFSKPVTATEMGQTLRKRQHLYA